jgi:hypothetical protein
MAELLALVATCKCLPTRFVAIRYWVFASRAWFTGHIAQSSLAARTAGNYIWGSRTVRRLRILWMASQLANVLPAVERTSTLIGTLERPYPCLYCSSAVRSDMRLVALLLFFSVMTHDVFLYLTTIAACRYPYLTGTARPVVTRSFASVFSARHQASADVIAAPTVLVISVDTTASD